MKNSFTFLIVFISVFSLYGQIEVRSGLELTPDHLPPEGGPRGELKGPFNFYSKIIEGTASLLAFYTSPIRSFQTSQCPDFPGRSAGIGQDSVNLTYRLSKEDWLTRIGLQAD